MRVMGCEEGLNNLSDREHMGNDETITGQMTNGLGSHIHPTHLHSSDSDWRTG